MRKFNNKSNLAGRVIEKYRLKRKMSREILAQKLQLQGLEIDRSTIFRIEKGTVILKDFELIIICKFLGINYKELESELNTEDEENNKIQ